jgi:hypothetical protein
MLPLKGTFMGWYDTYGVDMTYGPIQKKKKKKNSILKIPTKE